MSDRSGAANFDVWMRQVDQAIAALQRGDHMAGTVSVGRLLVGSIYIDDIRVINAQTHQTAVVLTDKKSGASCTVLLPCPDTDAPTPTVVPYVARFSMPGALANTTLSAGIYDVPPDSPPPGTQITQVKLNLSHPGTTTTTVVIVVNDVVLDTVSLLAGQTEFMKSYSGLWTFAWRNVPGRTVTDGVTSNAAGLSQIVASATANFTTNDIGSTISGGSIPVGTTILSILDPQHVGTSAASGATANNVTLTITPQQGFPLTDRLKAAVTASGTGASSLGINIYCGIVPAVNAVA